MLNDMANDIKKNNEAMAAYYAMSKYDSLTYPEIPKNMLAIKFDNKEAADIYINNANVIMRCEGDDKVEGEIKHEFTEPGWYLAEYTIDENMKKAARFRLNEYINAK